MRERLVIVFIAIAVGILTTTLIFFLYQQTKTVPEKSSNVIAGNVPSPSPAESGQLTIDEPADESIQDRRLIQIKGKASPESIIIVSTNQEDVVGNTTGDGRFSVSITIAAGSNKIVTRAISQNGEVAEDTRIVTFSTEEF